MVKKEVRYRKQKTPDSKLDQKVYFQWFYSTQSEMTVKKFNFFNINYIFFKTSNLYKNLV